MLVDFANGFDRAIGVDLGGCCVRVVLSVEVTVFDDVLHMNHLKSNAVNAPPSSIDSSFVLVAELAA